MNESYSPKTFNGKAGLPFAVPIWLALVFMWGKSPVADHALPLIGLIVFQFVSQLILGHAMTTVFRAEYPVFPECTLLNPSEAMS